ncbi:MAG: DUF2313 domain-containing protein [Clostridiaceae bacterium]|nr:DUF2313 domain-containing protein [Clostridiaceae bacterium]
MSAPELTNGDFLTALQALMPPGRAWPRGSEAVQTSVMAGLAPSFQRVAASWRALLVDALPVTPVLLLPEWQQTLGLPDSYVPVVTTLAQQQAQVAWKFANTGGQSAGYFEGLAASLGYAITVRSAAPFRCGQSKCGQSLGTVDQFYVINVHATDKELEALLKALMPAHTTVNIRTP